MCASNRHTQVYLTSGRLRCWKSVRSGVATRESPIIVNKMGPRRVSSTFEKLRLDEIFAFHLFVGINNTSNW